MPINAYVGLQGSGKSYEVVSTVIIEAIKKGRNVVTNIDGVSEPLIHAYIESQKGYKGQSLGKVVHVTNDRVEVLGFFPQTHTDEKSVVRPGDLVAIDEAWRFWGSGKSPTHQHMVFFREHRHFTHVDTGVSCDLVLMVQDISDLHKNLKNVVEMTVHTTKLKRVGLHNRYRVDVYEGSRLYRTRLTSSYQKSYDKEIFPLYSSYGGKGGNEQQVDKRQNMFAQRSFLVLGLFALLLICGGSWYVWGIFHPKPKLVAHSNSKPASPANSVAVSQSLAGDQVSSSFYIAGHVFLHGVDWVVVSDGSMLRYASPSSFNGSGLALVGTIDGKKITPWLPSRAQSGFLGK